MISVGLVIVTILILLRYILPNKELIAVERGKLDKYEFSSAYFKIYPVALLTTVVAALVFKEVLDSLYSKPANGYVFNLLPGTDYWMFGVVAMGLFFGLTAFFIMVKALFGDRSAYFWANYNSMYSFKAKTFLIAAWLVTGVTTIALTLVGQNTYFLIGQNDIKVKEPLEFNERTYGYADVKELNLKKFFTAPNGDLKNVEHYEIIFNDGYIWKSKNAIREPQENDKEFIDYISRLSHQPVNK